MTKRKRPTTLDQVEAQSVVKQTSKTPTKKKAKRPRLIADLPEGMKEEIVAISQHYDCTISDLVSYFIALGLSDYHNQALDINSMLIPIRSMNARYGLDFDYTPPPHQ